MRVSSVTVLDLFKIADVLSGITCSPRFVDAISACWVTGGEGALPPSVRTCCIHHATSANDQLCRPEYSCSLRSTAFRGRDNGIPLSHEESSVFYSHSGAAIRTVENDRNFCCHLLKFPLSPSILDERLEHSEYTLPLDDHVSPFSKECR